MRIISVLLAVALLHPGVLAEEKPLYLTVETPPAPELTAAEALGSFSLAPGFTVELVAAEPLVEDPVAITWDESGQLYVVEMRGFMPDAYGNNDRDPVGMVVRLTDADGDGRMDEREVLMDKLILPRAVAVVNEGLLVAEPPNLWLCPNKTGRSSEIDCDARVSLGNYGDQPGSVEHAENGLLIGVDNWIYNAKSNRRMQIDEGKLVVEPTLFRGQWGITQDNDGRLFYNTNSNLLLGDAYDAQAVVKAGNKRAPGLGERVSVGDQVYAARVNPGVNRAYVPGVLRPDGRLRGPTSASGMTVYRGDQFGSGHLNDVFVAEPAANALVQLKLGYDGLKMGTEHVLYPHDIWDQVEFFTSTDERFRPVDAKVGPDGALYVVDMYRGIIQDHVFITEQLRAQVADRQLESPLGMGRIWRIKANNVKSLETKPDLVSVSPDELVDLLGHANAWHRETAQRLLLVRQDRRLRGRLQKSVRTGERHQAVHALWTLSGRGELSRRVVLDALKRDDDSIELAAIRAGQDDLRRTDLLRLASSDRSPAVAQHVTLALAAHNEHADTQAVLLQQLSAFADDPVRTTAIRAAAFQVELPIVQALFAREMWSETDEQKTGFVQALAAQGFLGDESVVTQMLDFVASIGSEHRWLQVAVLDGIYDVSREDDFTRAMLASKHPLFNGDDESLWPAIAGARRAITWAGDDLASDAKPLSSRQQKNRALGADLYLSRCATCHAVDGKGIASLAPALVDSPWVTQSSERLARIILHGLHGPIEVAGEVWNGVMPGHGVQAELTDDVGAGLMTYLNRAWGHSGRAIDSEFFATIRSSTKDRNALWTVAELMEVDSNTHYRKYEGKYGQPGFGFQFVYNGSQLEVKSAIFNGPMKEVREDLFLYEARGLRLEFEYDDNNAVTGVRMLTGESEVVLPRLNS